MLFKKQYFTHLSAIAFLFTTTLGSLFAQVAAVAPPIEQQNKSFSDQDKAAFLKPGKVYYPETWFHFIGGNVAKKGITADLEAIAGAGISGITLFHGQFGGPWPHVDTPITCLSPLWDDAVRYTALECRRLGLKFSMENCPGWAMAGGPWIKPEEAMRQLVWSRNDIRGGKKVEIQLTMPQPSEEPWRDYKSVAVLAFPQPLDDKGDTLSVASAKSNGKTDWTKLLTNESKEPVSLDPASANNPDSFEVTFSKVVVVRTIQLPKITSFNYPFSYEPAVSIKVEAILPDGTATEILNQDLPESNFQDDIPLTLACVKDVPTNKLKLSIVNKHPISVAFVHFFSAARENNWETKAAWVLRSVGPSDQQYQQSAKAYIDPAQVMDISGYVNADGVLEWNAPPGDWTILRIGHVNAGKKNGPAPPEGTGWECDKLSTKGADAHFAGYIGRLSGSDGPLRNGLLTSMTMDSWECGAQNWTSDMATEFQRRSGYSLKQWMPALFGYVVKDQETSSRFLHDWKAAVNDLFTTNFYGRMVTLARQNNLGVTYETSAGDTYPGDILEYYKFADIPMCEFWQPFSNGFVGSLNFKPIKPCASAARLYGKPRVAAEAFTSFDLTWDEQWQMLKEVANVNMVEGVTHLVYHTFTHNPQTNFLPPGTSFGAGIGTPFLRQQIWWKYMPYLNAYFARCSYLLERGKPVSDVLWYLGDEIDHKPDQDAPFPRGFKYDYCNPDILLNRLSVKNGMLVTPEGIAYKVLWLPKTTHMLPQTLEKINALLHDGATVIGNEPKNIATLIDAQNAQRRFDAAVKDIWRTTETKGCRQVGKGRIISGLALPEALKELHLLPDVIGDSVLWVHRKTEGADWYFVTAPKGKAYKGMIDFRNSGNVEVWDPVTGQTTAAAAQEKNGYTSVSVDLPQAGSCFIVFGHDEKPTAGAAKPGIKKTEKLDARWNLGFPSGWGAPAAIQLDSLQAWKDLPVSDEGRAFSGTATYTTTFEIKSKGKVLVDLGTVSMIAKVTINGKDAGVVWSSPYQVDITKWVLPGSNTLKVEVTSTWFNRLAYDARQPEEKRKTWTISGPPKDAALHLSGLLGPVTLVITPSRR